MIFVRVELGNGQTHEEWATCCLALAQRFGVGLEVEPNGVKMNVFINDTVPEILARYHLMAGILGK
jgi:hypothetical protein